MRALAKKPKATPQTTSAKSAIHGRTHLGQSGEVASILHLQRTIGNQAVQRLLEANAVNVEGDSTTTKIARFGHDLSRVSASAKAPVKTQTKLTVKTPGDVYEQEADRIADQVMATPTHSAVNGPPQRIQGFSYQSDGQTDAAPPSVDQTLASPGRPLEPTIRQDMEQRFGYDFSHVRVHSGAAAEQSAREVNANAYTAGHNVVFGAGRYAPETHEGRRLIAHELTHVVQQSGDLAAPATMLARDPDDPNEERARTLAKKLDKKRDEVLNTLGGLTKKDLDALDAAAAKMRGKQSDELRRAIRFVAHKPVAMPNKNVVKVVDAGTPEPKAKAEKVAAGEVEFRRGVSYQSAAGNSTEAYSLTYKGTDASEMRWLQFIWREVVPQFPPAVKGGSPRKVPVRKRLDHGSNVYHLTTDSAKPIWSTDSPSHGSAFYEENTTVNRSTDQLTMFDAPSSMQSDVAAFFKGTTGQPDRVVSHFHATTYLIRSMDVLYRVEIDVTWEFTKGTPATGPAAQVTAKKGKAGSVDPAHRARLAYQYPDVDYLPGPSISAPHPMDAFDPVPDLAPAGSIQEKDWASKGDLERYADIAAIAHAEWINDVTGMSETTINNVGTTGSVKPGLNYSAKLAVEGETGFIDAKDVYHNPALPTDAAGPLPRVAIILGPKAFARDKAFALATMRHEMEHASHNQLAIGWLLKWRDGRTGKSFKDWLGEEQKGKRISEVEFALASTGVTKNLTATEALAWTEGFVTALPFLPAKPEFRLMASGDYPAAIAGLKGAGREYNAVSSAAVKKAALARISGFSCSALTQKQRDALIKWIPFLLDPNSLNPTKADEQTVKLMNNEFPPLKDFLQQVLSNVKKTCPK